MGATFYIVNLDKREYLDPHMFGDFRRSSGYMEGRHATAAAMLTCDASGLGVGPPAGSWCGNRVVAVTDGGPPNQHSMQTATEDEPDRNIYMMACQEFQNISYEAIAMVCNWSSSFADKLAERAKFDDQNEASEYLKTLMLWHLGSVISRTNCPSLRQSLERHFGEAWESRFHEATTQHGRADMD